jgi:hypothetical protein
VVRVSTERNAAADGERHARILHGLDRLMIGWPLLDRQRIEAVVADGPRCGKIHASFPFAAPSPATSANKSKSRARWLVRPQTLPHLADAVICDL